ncbi:VolA/Pla-1 family phospholipase [Vibrio vulnificus]|uniref:VolA/Pla-1 family phospholipase n=1 Tax=Vibrio vulnificus TaxID=672 RepID=UPI000CD04D2A|nr:VolA/Pla-1 family phospholipase [Vibrio vulnificus]EHH0802939.1 lipase [Vibrio vulnificus]POC27232.1 lipase [Vibrio vulnificus]
MKHTFKLSLLCSAILLVGCGDNTESSGTTGSVTFEPSVQELLGRETSINFNLKGTSASVPLPSYVLMDTTDGTLGIPTNGDDALTNPRAAMNTMDGWSTSMPIVLPFEGAGFNERVLTSGVRVIKLNQRLTDWDGQSNPIDKVLAINTDFVVQTKENSLFIVFKDSLNESSEYIFSVSDTVLDKNDNPVGTSTSYATAKSTQVVYESGSLASIQKVTKATESILAMADADVIPSDIVYSSWFSTQSIGDTLAAVKGVTATGFSTGPNTLNTVYKNDSNPGAVDLSTAYTLTFGATKDFSTALSEDGDFDKYIAEGDATAIATLKYGINSMYGQSGAQVNVTSGTARLPYYLETGADWNSQPFVSAMPSLAKLSAALKIPAEAAYIQQQLSTGDFANAPVDLANLATSLTEQLKLVGSKITLLDGSQLDSERIITRYSPVPKVKSLQEVEFLLFTPNAQTPSDVVIYQHGITSAKENAYAFVFNLVKEGVAVLAIDLPIHGTRSLDDQRSANANVLAYLNLTNLPVARDNVRQSILDVLGLRASLVISAKGGLLASSPLSGFNPAAGSKVRMLGHSLGGIVGTSAVATANQTLGSPTADVLYTFSAASIQNSGGQIANLLLGSERFGPIIKHQLTLASTVPSFPSYKESCGSITDEQEIVVCYNKFVNNVDNRSEALKMSGVFSSFAYAAQTVLDTIDPFTNVAGLSYTGATMPSFYFGMVDGDKTVPNNVANAKFAGTIPLATKLNLTVVDASNPTASAATSFVQFNSGAGHVSFVTPNSTQSDLNHHLEMQKQTADFLKDDALSTVTDASVLK